MYAHVEAPKNLGTLWSRHVFGAWLTSRGGFRGGSKGPYPQDAKHCAIWHWNNAMHCNKNAINDIKLCLSFPPGLKFQAVYF